MNPAACPDLVEVYLDEPSMFRWSAADTGLVRESASVLYGGSGRCLSARDAVDVRVVGIFLPPNGSDCDEVGLACGWRPAGGDVFGPVFNAMRNKLVLARSAR